MSQKFEYFLKSLTEYNLLVTLNANCPHDSLYLGNGIPSNISLGSSYSDFNFCPNDR
jgi:hypothetical protein